MPQLSRPLQVALAAVALLAVVWFVALRGHSSSSESTATTPSAATSTTPASSSSSSGPGAPSSVYHGSAPGVEGLTRDIQKAHAAAAQSEQNAAQLEQKSAQASGDSASPAAHSTGGTSTAAAGATHSSTPTRAAKAAHAHAKAHAHKPASGTRASTGTAGQTWVEHQLARKTTVALLFYSPHSSDDLLVRSELERVVGAERGRHVKIALRLATGEQVGEYGSFTRVSSVYQTPTLLLITPSGEVKPPITGFTDACSIEQAIGEKTQP
jgi:hypothetical protein